MLRDVCVRVCVCVWGGGKGKGKKKKGLTLSGLRNIGGRVSCEGIRASFFLVESLGIPHLVVVAAALRHRLLHLLLLKIPMVLLLAQVHSPPIPGLSLQVFQVLFLLRVKGFRRHMMANVFPFLFQLQKIFLDYWIIVVLELEPV